MTSEFIFPIIFFVVGLMCFLYGIILLIRLPFLYKRNEYGPLFVNLPWPNFGSDYIMKVNPKLKFLSPKIPSFKEALTVGVTGGTPIMEVSPAYFKQIMLTRLIQSLICIFVGGWIIYVSIQSIGIFS